MAAQAHEISVELETAVGVASEDDLLWQSVQRERHPPAAGVRVAPQAEGWGPRARPPSQPRPQTAHEPQWTTGSVHDLKPGRTTTSWRVVVKPDGAPTGARGRHTRLVTAPAVTWRGRPMPRLHERVAFCLAPRAGRRSATTAREVVPLDIYERATARQGCPLRNPG